MEYISISLYVNYSWVNTREINQFSWRWNWMTGAQGWQENFAAVYTLLFLCLDRLKV